MRETIVKACSLAERVPAKTLCSIIQDSLPGELDIAGMIESVITFVTAEAKVCVCVHVLFDDLVSKCVRCCVQSDQFQQVVTWCSKLLEMIPGKT